MFFVFEIMMTVLLGNTYIFPLDYQWKKIEITSENFKYEGLTSATSIVLITFVYFFFLCRKILVKKITIQARENSLTEVRLSGFLMPYESQSGNAP